MGNADIQAQKERLRLEDQNRVQTEYDRMSHQEKIHQNLQIRLDAGQNVTFTNPDKGDERTDSKNYKQGAVQGINPENRGYNTKYVDVGSKTGGGQGNRGYNFKTETDTYEEGASPERRTNENPSGGYLKEKNAGLEFTKNKSGQYTRELTPAELEVYNKTHQTGRVEDTQWSGKKEYQKSDTGFPVVTNPVPIYNREGTGRSDAPFKSRQPDENALAGYANPTWTYDGKTFEDKKDVDEYIKSHPPPNQFSINLREDSLGKREPVAFSVNLRETSYGTREPTAFSVNLRETSYGTREPTAFSVDLQENSIGKEPEYIPTRHQPGASILIGNQIRAFENYELENANKKDLLSQAGLFGAGLAKSFLVGYAGSVNLAGALANAPPRIESWADVILKGNDTSKIEPIQLKNIPSSVIIGGAIRGDSPESIRAGLEEYTKRHGLSATLGASVIDIMAAGALTGGLKSVLGGVGRAGLEKVIRPTANKFIIRNVDKMVDAKPFSYEIPYKPAKRANEINYNDFGERIGKSESILAKPKAATQADVILKGGKKPNLVQPENFYKPAKRANEISFGSGIVPKEDVRGSIKFSKDFIPNKTEPPIKGKTDKPIEMDSTYRPAKRANEIDFSDSTLVEFKNTKINLGKGITEPRTAIVKGKQVKPVEADYFYKPAKRANEIDFSDNVLTRFTKTKVKLGRGRASPIDLPLKGKEIKPVEADYFYKPAKRANEIDLTDSAGDFKPIKKEELKSEVQFDLERELKRIKKKNPEFKSERVSFDTEGKYIAGKSGRQELLQIQKAEQTTKQKLITKRKTPININWSAKADTAHVPKGGKSPITILIPPLKREEKKKQVSGSSYYQNEVILHDNRPQISARTMTGSSLSSLIGARTNTVQKERVGFRIETKPVQKLFSPQKTKPMEKQKLIEQQKQSQKQKPKQTYRTPEIFKQPPKQTQTPKQKQPTREALKTPELFKIPPEVKFIIPIPPPPIFKPKKGRTRKAKPSEDFLGNTRTNKFEGFFRRNEILLGDKRTEKQVIRDKRATFNSGFGLGFSNKKKLKL